MKLYDVLLYSLFVILMSCTSSLKISDDKVNPFLIKEIESKKEINSRELIDFSGICVTEITNTIKNEIEECGVNIQTVSKQLFTGNGDYQSLIKLSNKEFIKWLDAARTLNPTESNN